MGEDIRDVPEDEPLVDQEEALPELDLVDPLKRDPDHDTMPGLDPVLPPIPPE